jgi:hypothetical protein
VGFSEFICERRQSLYKAIGVSLLDFEVLMLLIAEIAKPLSELKEAITTGNAKETHPIDLHGFLSAYRQRRNRDERNEQETNPND